MKQLKKKLKNDTAFLNAKVYQGKRKLASDPLIVGIRKRCEAKRCELFCV